MDKNWKILSITKSQVNRILRAKYGKPLKVRKVFYLNEEAKKKRLDFCKNIIQIGLEGKYFFHGWNQDGYCTKYKGRINKAFR